MTTRPFLSGITIPSSSLLLAGLLSCTATSVETGDAGAAADSRADTAADHASVDRFEKPDAAPDGQTGDKCEVGGECRFQDGCMRGGGMRYDMDRGCFDQKISFCYEAPQYPPAAPVTMADPEGNCWLLYNPPYEIYGAPTGWTSHQDPRCMEALGPSFPWCDDAGAQ